MSAQPTTGGFSLFPSPNASAGPSSRHATPRPRTATPLGSSRERQPSSAVDAPSPSAASPPRTARHGGVERKRSVKEGKQREQTHASTNSGSSSGSGATGAAAGGPAMTRGTPLPPLRTVWSEDVQFEIVQRPAPVAVVESAPPPRCETAFSEAQTLVRSNSNRSRGSATGAKAGPTHEQDGGSRHQLQQQQSLRSIFPVYNHALPPDRQEYYPTTQAGPAQIPRNAINRPLYSPPMEATSPPAQQQQHQRPPSPQSYQYHAQPAPYGADQRIQYQQQQQQQQYEQSQQQQIQYQHQQQQQQYQSQPAPSAMGASPPGPSVARWPPPRGGQAPVAPPVSSTEELRGLWKVVSGWRATGAEGRVYCLKMTAERDTPIYTLSSASQPFYNLRIDPTSASAYVTLSRHDPAKAYRAPLAPSDAPLAPSPTDLASPPGLLSAGSPSGSSPTQPLQPASVVGTGRKDGKHWHEALSTTLEEQARRHAPHDGLVALLYPTAAARVALERPDDSATIATAERECARLVWDDDTGNHYLVHPALAMPFCVTVDRNAAWSRTEYTLEHLESPRHVARLTRDGSGNGWLELDTAIAGKVESAYLVEVAVAALMLVAHGDAQFVRNEVLHPAPAMMIFSPPPGSESGGGGGGGKNKKNKKKGLFGGGDGRDSRASGGSKKSAKKNGSKSSPRSRMDEFELDLESQTSDLKRLDVGDKDKKLPGLVRGILGLLRITFKCFIWVLTACFKTLTGCISVLARCLTSKKL
ncbi:hypothetical protein RB595_003342 [Gaeumannomyces hyphopodioides]